MALREGRWTDPHSALFPDFSGTSKVATHLLFSSSECRQGQDKGSYFPLPFYLSVLNL